jgi:hypothetical protein
MDFSTSIPRGQIISSPHRQTLLFGFLQVACL